jgi:hypothetical protein
MRVGHWTQALAALLFIATASTVCAAPMPAAAAPQPATMDSTIRRTFEVLGPGMFSPAALLYEPLSAGSKSHIAVVVMHSDVNYLNFSACTELSKRGYRVLCANRSGQPGSSLDSTLLDLKQAVAFLRGYPGVSKIVLLGHSGGATLMSAYQFIAEGGLKACQAVEKIHKCPDSVANLPPADGVMLIDSNWGNAEMALLSLDPAVTSEQNGTTLNADLDSFNPTSGFVKGGTAHYNAAFLKRFESGVVSRERRLVQHALEREAAIQAGKGLYKDDEALIIPGANQAQSNNRLFPQDTALLAHTAKPQILLHADGSSTTEIVHSVRVPEANGDSPTPDFRMGTVETTVQTFLTNWAIRVSDDFHVGEDTVHGVEWTSTYSSTPGNVEGIHSPLLVMGMTGHYEYLASETIFNNARSTDKSLAFVEGGTHGYTTCKECEKTPGQFGDTQKTTYDYIDQWLSGAQRF